MNPTQSAADAAPDLEAIEAEFNNLLESRGDEFYLNQEYAEFCRNRFPALLALERELQEAMRWRAPSEWNNDVWPKRIWVTDGRQAHVINMEHHTFFPVGLYTAWMLLPPLPTAPQEPNQR